MKRVPLTKDKIEAVRAVTGELCWVGVDAYSLELDPVLADALARLSGHANPGVSFRGGDTLPGTWARTHFLKEKHEPPPLDHRNERPKDFPDRAGTECSPAFTVLTVANGYLLRIGHAPVALLPSGDCVISDFSSRYARLLRGYDLDLPRALAGARRIKGEALALCDDVWPLNYSHWLLDELPRLAFLGARRDLSVVIGAPAKPFQYETLARCGFAPERIVAVEDFSAVQADRLLVCRDMREMPHPAFKGAGWALGFLRSRFLPADAGGRDRKLYVSRGDSRGRYLAGEEELMGLLAPLGYERLTLGMRDVSEQAALFASATHVISLHGAGLANLAFARPGTRVIELFPKTYGTPAFWVVAAAAGCRYATYVGNVDVIEQRYEQVHDARLDLDHFARACGDIL